MKVRDGVMFPQAIAVTGGIGSGKSRVAYWLAQACAFPLYDADSEVRALLELGAAGWQCLRARLSPDYFGVDGGLLKAKLRQAIFVDELLRQTVEHEIHPLVLARLQAKIFGNKGRCLVEVPLLYEAQWHGYFGGVLVVYAPDDRCCERVMIRDGIPENQALAAIRVQLPIKRKASMADYLIDNSNAWIDTLCQLEKIKKKWCPAEQEKKLDSRIG
jgi:dephospho-CoA kinase